jgi:hypothetical protein
LDGPVGTFTRGERQQAFARREFAARTGDELFEERKQRLANAWKSP